MENTRASAYCTLTDRKWSMIENMLPPERNGLRGRPATRSNRQIIGALAWILETGAPWRDLPGEFGPWKSVYTRFRRWKVCGLWEQIRQVLAQDAPAADGDTSRCRPAAAGISPRPGAGNATGTEQPDAARHNNHSTAAREAG